MGIKTAIDYCDTTVNPVMGCLGCELYHPDPTKNICFAADLCKRRAGLKGWPADFNRPEHFPGRLEKAIRWSDLTGKERPGKPWLNGMPRVIFVNDLSDGFCFDGVSPEIWLLPHQEAMGQSPHIWLILSKWTGKMYRYFAEYGSPPNFWIGTTLTGRHSRVDQMRIFHLLLIDAAVHWLSVEPLLGDVVANFEQGSGVENVDWITAGGASGRNAPPTHPFHSRALRDFARGWGIPFFWKQNGEYIPFTGPGPGPTRFRDGTEMIRVGKKRAGRLLGGVEWSEMPEVRKCLL